ncbi:MAG: hypothetical protein V1822_01935, partial [Candidatus Micrarchaeota archaeon]
MAGLDFHEMVSEWLNRWCVGPMQNPNEEKARLKIFEAINLYQKSGLVYNDADFETQYLRYNFGKILAQTEKLCKEAQEAYPQARAPGNWILAQTCIGQGIWLLRPWKKAEEIYAPITRLPNPVQAIEEKFDGDFRDLGSHPGRAQEYFEKAIQYNPFAVRDIYTRLKEEAGYYHGIDARGEKVFSEMAKKYEMYVKDPPEVKRTPPLAPDSGIYDKLKAPQTPDDWL